MKKDNRLLKNEDFQKVINKRSIKSNTSFTVYSLINNLDHIRIGISVSKKLGKAVIRNKIKRQIRMMCQELFNINDCIDLVIIPKHGYLSNSYQDNYLNLKIIANNICKEINI